MLLHPNPLCDFIIGVSTSIHTRTRLNSVFLDTTYCSPAYNFPSQDEVIRHAVQLTRDFLRENPFTLVVCGMYTIGKERFVNAIAMQLDLGLYMPKKRYQLIKLAADNGCSICSNLISKYISDPRKAQLHVLPMQQLNLNALNQYRLKLAPKVLQNTPFTMKCPQSRRILAWRPTGWTHVPQCDRNSGYKQQILSSSGEHPPGLILVEQTMDITIYGAAYSEHSSFVELQEFITTLRPIRVQPTVFSGVAKSARNFINIWIKSDLTRS